MDLKFTVIFKEPLTPFEADQAALGISPDPRPILDRWAARSELHKEMRNNIAYVEDPSDKDSDSGLMFENKRDKQNAKMANKNRGNRRYSDLDR